MHFLARMARENQRLWEFDGKELKNITIKQSENLGIAFVHQELNLFNDLKVYENIFLQKEYTTKFGCLDKKKMIQEAERLFQELGVDIDLKQNFWFWMSQQHH